METKDVITESGLNIFQSALQVLIGDPLGGIESFWSGIHKLASVRDAIFFDSFKCFLLNTYDDATQKERTEENVKCLAEVLAAASPNWESGYAGDSKVLIEYAKRIIKTIDECGTIQKAEYIANLARSIRRNEIDTPTFFRLCKCVTNLTEEDLEFINETVSKETVTTDEEFIDDFRSLGLMKEVDGGFDYTKRAFLLKKYALNYEGNTDIPDSFRSRQIMSVASDADIQNIIDNLDIDDNGQLDGKIKNIADKAVSKKLEWGEF